MGDTSRTPYNLVGSVPMHPGVSPTAHSPADDSYSSKDIVTKTIGPSGPLVKKRFTSSWLKRRASENDEDGIRGPTGLRALHLSPEPLIDLVLVHGLRGGSIKTWRKGDDPRMFWPKLWLPMEPGLRNVSIHSFGYDSDWASTKSSILNVHDFGQSLLEEMRNSPHLRENSGRPIILLGHSMGGLVIKKAFVLAKDIEDFRDRVKCIFFLATPHRGSDYAALLNNVLAMSGVLSPREYINDLKIGSTSAELINSDFGKYAQNLPIFSFYESVPMNLGFSSNLIVRKSSAVLGPSFTNERVQYMNANHRDICKFESIDDPNYVTLRNALTSAVANLLKDIYESSLENSRKQMKALKAYLGVSGQPDECFPTAEGSCQWIDARDDFQDWRDPPGEYFFGQGDEKGIERPSIFWVHANPGTGKTYLASHVVAQLHSFQLECACYYFHIGGKSTSSLGESLRSIAYQMATSNASIRQTLVSLSEEDISFDLDDPRKVWSKIFEQGIFRSPVHTPQYWVIDALDECTKYQEFFAIIRGSRLSFPLRIFITSRKVPDMQRLCRIVEGSIRVTCIEVPIENTMSDIERYVYRRIEDFSIDTLPDKQNLASTIIHKSNASFLWVRLVLDELEHVYSNEGVLRVLQSIPEGMAPYYERAVKSMMGNKLEKHISQAVILWTVVSSRDLTVSELSQALTFDIKTVLPSAKNAVEGLCGQLVVVNASSGLVSLVHPTAREFLLSEAAGEFYVSRPLANERIALACLKLLCSSDMQPPRNRQRLSRNVRPKAPMPFLDYAMTQFSEHIYGAADTDELILAIDRFFKTNVLSWIERIAQKGDLYYLTRASKNLKAYLDRRPSHRLLKSNQVSRIDSWPIDLGRIVTKYGAVLLQDPTSIYFIIPPLCPSNSAIYQQFGKRQDGLAVVGFKSEAWDDCIASIGFDEDNNIPATITSGENLIVVGVESGDVVLYNRVCQKIKVIHYKHPIDLVHFTGRYVATCTTRTIDVRDLEGNTLWEHRFRYRCISLSSSKDLLFAITEHGHLLKWKVSDGSVLKHKKFPYRAYEGAAEQSGLSILKAPSLASISPDSEMLALGYSDSTVCLWDLQIDELVAWALDEEKKLASVMMFNPNPNINLLLVIYTNHDLSLYDTWSGSLMKSHKMAVDTGILSASCSPDGRNLATIDTRGNLQVWDFESLSLLYHVLCPAASFRLLTFTSDGSSIVDATDYGMCVWSPAALIFREKEEDQSSSRDSIQSTVIEGQYESLRTARITALCVHPSLPIIFAGKYTGQIITYSAQTGQQVSLLYSHPHTAFITELVVSKNNIIASGDANDVVQVWKIAAGQPSVLDSKLPLLHASFSTRVMQLCFSADGNFLLVATARSDVVYSMKDGSCIGSLSFEPSERCAWRWTQGFHSGGGEEFVLLDNHTMKRYSADTFPLAVAYSEINLEYELENGDVEMAIQSAFVYTEAHVLVLEVRYMSGYLPSSSMFIFDLNGISYGEERITLKPLNDALSRCSMHFIGVSQRMKSIVFLHRDSWLCSFRPESIEAKYFSRHFFVPNEYIPSSNQVLPLMSTDDSVVFCLHGELAIVRNGLKFQEVHIME